VLSIWLERAFHLSFGLFRCVLFQIDAITESSVGKIYIEIWIPRLFVGNICARSVYSRTPSVRAMDSRAVGVLSSQCWGGWAMSGDGLEYSDWRF
jgi:hypothetical protein